MSWQLIIILALGGLVLGWFLAHLAMRLITRWSDFKSECVNISGRSFELVELTAQQRVEYMRRCAGLNSSDGYELIRDDLAVSADLIALHLRRLIYPNKWVLFWVKRLSIETIAELFKRCVTLSNIPFDIKEQDETFETLTEADQGEDDWDYLDSEKKSSPAVRQ